MGKGDQTRQEIIRKAAPIFNQRGYDGAALSDLMKATGLEKGGIYRHFESKEQLAAEAFDYAWGLAIETRFEGTQQIPNTVDRLKQVVRNFQDRRSGLVPASSVATAPPAALATISRTLACLPPGVFPSSRSMTAAAFRRAPRTRSWSPITRSLTGTSRQTG